MMELEADGQEWVDPCIVFVCVCVCVCVCDGGGEG